jgi:RNA polymerase primary sigma factor
MPKTDAIIEALSDRSAGPRAESAPEPTSFIHSLTRQRLLTADEEVQLTNRSRAGDWRAKHRLIESNMRLVINIAKHYHSSLIPFEDLVQEGAIGLMTACERYDPSRGYRFSTYATHWIKQAISRAIDNKAHAIRVPAHVSETLRKIERMRLVMQREGDEEPSIECIAQRLGIPPHKLSMYLQAGQDPISLDMLVGDEESTSLASLLNDKTAPNPETVLVKREILVELQCILDTLNDREKMVMRKRLGLDDDDETHVLQDIGTQMRISRERVRQIEAQAIKRLRAAASRRKLRELLAE